MPDWTYHTIFKPMLTRISFAKAQAMVFGSMGMLAATAPGRWLIRLMGHGKPPEEMTVRRGDFTFAAPTALSAEVDCDGRATNALGLFVFGLAEVGPNGAMSRGDHTLRQLEARPQAFTQPNLHPARD